MTPAQHLSPARGRDRIQRGSVEIADHTRQHRRSPFGRRRGKGELQQRMLAVADDRRAVLAVDDQRMIVDQDHADLVLDIQVRRDRKTETR
jgi:hypothetical protein